MALRSSRRRRAKREIAKQDAQAAGASDIPENNLLMADLVMRTGSFVLRNFVEKKFLKGRFDNQTAKQIVKDRSLKSELASVAIAKFATRSVPGAAIVGTGVLIRALYNRGKLRRDAMIKDLPTIPASDED